MVEHDAAAAAKQVKSLLDVRLQQSGAASYHTKFVSICVVHTSADEIIFHSSDFVYNYQPPPAESHNPSDSTSCELRNAASVPAFNIHPALFLAFAVGDYIKCDVWFRKTKTCDLHLRGERLLRPRSEPPSHLRT